jgi:hypothetical protein
MAAHIDREYVKPIREMRSEMVEVVSGSRDPVEEDEWLLAARPPVEVMQTQTVERDELVGSGASLTHRTFFVHHPSSLIA